MSRTTSWAARTFAIAAVLVTGIEFLRSRTGIDLGPLDVVLTGITNVGVVVFLVLVTYDLARWVARRRRIARDQAGRGD